MKILCLNLICLFLINCKNENFDHKNKTSVDISKVDSVDIKVKNKQSMNDAKFTFANDPIFNSLFVIKLKDLVSVKNHVDTSIAFNFSLKNNRYSREVKRYFKENKMLFSKANGVNTRAFFLNKIKVINDTTFLGIFVEYFGFERIYYSYGKLILGNKNLHIKSLYNTLDETGIGKIYFNQLFKLNNKEFCIIGNNKGEGHQSISLHYFPKNYENKTYLIEKCNPSSEANPHDEKLEYNVDYKNKIVNIDKFEIERDKESDWRKLSSNSYNILDLIDQLKK